MKLNGKSLNPCFTGICSLRKIKELENGNPTIVLILVLLEYAL